MLKPPQKIILLVLLGFGFLFVIFLTNVNDVKHTENKGLRENLDSNTLQIHIEQEVMDASADEGFLWVDRTTEQYIVTLGAAHGVLPGTHLKVFHGDRYIGEVEVQITFESISYVDSQAGDEMFEEGDYYKVVAYN